MSLSDLNISDKILKCHDPENKRNEAMFIGIAVGTGLISGAMVLATLGGVITSTIMVNQCKGNRSMIIPTIACFFSTLTIGPLAIMIPSMTSGFMVCHIIDIRQKDHRQHINNVGAAAARTQS